MSLLPLRLFSATSVIEFIIQFDRSFTGTKNIWYNRLCTQKIFKYNIYTLNINIRELVWTFIMIWLSIILYLYSKPSQVSLVDTWIQKLFMQTSLFELRKFYVQDLNDINSLIKILTCSFRFHAKASLSYFENVSPVQ